MARDYKPPKKGPTATSRPGSWVSFVTGLGLGLGVAILVYLWAQHPPRHPSAELPSAVAPPTAPELSAVETPEATPNNTNTLSLPKFDFYKILPEIEVKVPDAELNAPPPAAQDAATNRANAATAYMLQVGSYQKFDEADQSKAQLALQGIQATIQRVVIKGSDVWFRVHVGPYKTLPEVQRNRARLAQLGVTAIVLRLGDPG